MQINRTYTYRLEPTVYQSDRLNRLAGCARWVWNRAVQLTRTYRAHGESVPGYAEVAGHLRSWKQAFPWLATDGQHHVLQQKLRDLDRAWQAAFDANRPWMREPRFKRRGDGDSVRFPDRQQFAVAGDRIKLPKIGRVRFRKSRNLPADSEVRSVVVTREGGHWFAHLQIAYEVPDPGYHPRDRSSASTSAWLGS